MSNIVKSGQQTWLKVRGANYSIHFLYNRLNQLSVNHVLLEKTVLNDALLKAANEGRVHGEEKELDETQLGGKIVLVTFRKLLDVRTKIVGGMDELSNNENAIRRLLEHEYLELQTKADLIRTRAPDSRE